MRSNRYIFFQLQKYVYRPRSLLTRSHSASEMTFIVSGGALNSTHSLTVQAVIQL